MNLEINEKDSIAVVYSANGCGPFEIADLDLNLNPHAYLDLFLAAPDMLTVLELVLIFAQSGVYTDHLWGKVKDVIDRAKGL